MFKVIEMKIACDVGRGEEEFEMNERKYFLQIAKSCSFSPAQPPATSARPL
jgi:hypothetical protein